MTTPSEISGDVVLNGLMPGSLIDVETTSRHYHIECLGGNEIRISGHPEYCPQPTAALLQGSVNKNGVLESGRIERGMRLMLFLDDVRPLMTSKVVNFHVVNTDVDQPVQPQSFTSIQ